MYLEGIIFRRASIKYLLACSSSSKTMLWGYELWALRFLILDDSATLVLFAGIFEKIVDWKIELQGTLYPE